MIPIVTTADTSGAQEQAKAIEKLSDESQRYNRVLLEMAKAQEAAERAQQKAVQSANDLAKSGERAKQNAQYKDYVKQVDKEIADGVINVGQKEVEAAEAAAAAADKAFVSKKQLKDMVKGLGQAFPELGHLAHLALNPMVFTVAGISGAFLLWKTRVEALTESLSRLRLPDLGPQTVSKVSAMAEAQQKIADAVRNARESYNAIDSVHQRYVARLQEELGLQRSLLEAKKAHDLATLESNKGGMSVTEYQSRRLGIEKAYSNAGLNSSQATETEILNDLERERDLLKKSSNQKLAKAAGMKLPSNEDKFREDALNADRDAQTAEAQKTIKEARDRMNDLGKMADSYGRFVVGAPGLMVRYGSNATIDDALKMENENVRKAQEVIASNRKYQQGNFKRQQEYKRRDTLEEQAANEAARAAEIEASLPEAKQRLANKQRMENATTAEQQAAEKIGLAGAERDTPLGQNILRAAKLAKDYATGVIKPGAMSQEDQDFLKQMDQGMTGDKYRGSWKRALQSFGGADQNPEAFVARYGRMNNVAAVRQDAETANALARGQAVSEESKNQLVQHTRLLTGVQTTIQQSVRLMEHAADTMMAINTRIAQLEQRQRDLDARVRNGR